MNASSKVSRIDGFTLIELLAVMAILAILMTVAVVQYQKFEVRGQETKTSATIEQVKGAVMEYTTLKGDAPPDDFSGIVGRPTNDLNVGIESLVAHLSLPTYSGVEVDEDHLGNTDEDKFAKSVTRFGTADAFEYKDSWGNPLAYFHCKSYLKKQKALVKLRGGEVEEQEVVAVKNPVTAQYFNPTGFQLISAGYDGRFGTDDDIANFAKPH